MVVALLSYTQTGKVVNHLLLKMERLSIFKRQRNHKLLKIETSTQQFF